MTEKKVTDGMTEEQMNTEFKRILAGVGDDVTQALKITLGTLAGLQESLEGKMQADLERSMKDQETQEDELSPFPNHMFKQLALVSAMQMICGFLAALIKRYEEEQGKVGESHEEVQG